MSITRFGKATYRDFLMDFFSWMATHFTPSTRKFTSYNLSCLPSYPSIITLVATSPTGMSSSSHVLRLPFSHTEIITEGSLTVKISSSTCNWLTTPITKLSDLIGTARVRSTKFPLLSTFPRAILLIKFTRAFTRFAAYQASRLWLSLSHTSIIPHIEIEERYCEISAKRCSQQVFNLSL